MDLAQQIFTYITWPFATLWSYGLVPYGHQFMADLHQLTWAAAGTFSAIIFVEAALSGDNSTAIVAKSRDLADPRQQMLARWIGMVLAVVLRVVALAVAAFLLRHPDFQLLGAAYLFMLTYNHFRQASESEEEAKRRKAATKLWVVVVAIAFLDLSLSLDNIAGVVALTQNLALITISVAFAILFLALAMKLMEKLMSRYANLEHAAFVIIGFLGVVMVCEHFGEGILSAVSDINALAAYFSIDFAIAISESTRSTLGVLQFKFGEAGEIVGVFAIALTAIGIDEFARHRQRVAAKERVVMS